VPPAAVASAVAVVVDKEGRGDGAEGEGEQLRCMLRLSNERNEVLRGQMQQVRNKMSDVHACGSCMCTFVNFIYITDPICEPPLPFFNAAANGAGGPGGMRGGLGGAGEAGARGAAGVPGAAQVGRVRAHQGPERGKLSQWWWVCCCICVCGWMCALGWPCGWLTFE
jgi:hypothetical protein